MSHKLMLRCKQCGHVYWDGFDMALSAAEGDTSAAHAPLDDCPNCDANGDVYAEVIRNPAFTS
jgi:uncharacterized Zn finger protein